MAISLISPGLKITEQDLVSSSQSIAATTGAFAGQFRWGPINEPVVITSETELVSKFGKPNATNVVDFLSAANFLNYSAPLYVVRAANTALNSTADGTGVLVANEDDYNDASLSVGAWVAKYAGKLGDSLKVSVCPSSSAWQSTLTGTVTIAAGSKVVVGSGTDFANDVVVGDYLVAGGRSIKVAAVTNATHLTVTTAHLTGATAGSTAVRRWEYYGEFDAAPGTSTYAESKGASGDEMHVVIVDADGDFTGTPGSLLEKYNGLSKASDARADNGGSNYYKTVINDLSSYVWWADHDASGTNWGDATIVSGSATTYTAVSDVLNYSLGGGADGNDITSGNRSTAYSYFANKQQIPASLIIAGQANADTINRLVADIAEIRKDAVVCASPSKASVVNNSGSEASDIVTWSSGVTRSTYLFVDSGWKYQYDKYNDTYVYVPLNADTAGCMARNDANREPWLSPAGFINGRVQNLVRLAYNPTQSDRDVLYKNSVNPVITQVGKGTVLYGDKTFTTKNTSLNRVNVRRLFIELQNTIGEAADNVLFDQNDATTRNSFVGLVVPYLRSVQARRGISAFRVICDESNNPEDVVNANEFVCDIFIQPIRSVNFIQLNFVSVRGTATFNEIAG